MSDRNVGHEIAEAARKGLVGPKGYEKLPGFCARWVRQVLATVPRIVHMPQGLPSAKAQAAWFVGRVPQVPPTMIREGDVLYWTKPSHGPHGHVAISLGGLLIAENSTAQDYSDRDARGMRYLRKNNMPDKVFRFEAL